MKKRYSSMESSVEYATDQAAFNLNAVSFLCVCSEAFDALLCADSTGLSMGLKFCPRVHVM